MVCVLGRSEGMLALLCSLLAAVHVLATASTDFSECSDKANQTVAVKGWPVVVALRVPIMASFSLELNFSADNAVHTTLSLNHSGQQKMKVGLLEAVLGTWMAMSKLETAALLPDSSWAALKIAIRSKKLELRAHSEVDSINYTTIALLHLTQAMEVDTVSCSGRECRLVDLQCLNTKRSDSDKDDHTPEVKPTPSSGKASYYWAFYAVISLLVTVCLLFFIWRNERNKFRNRWLRHAQSMRHATASSTSQEGNTPQTEVTSDAVAWKKSGTHCAFAYKGPCIGDSD